MPDQDTHPIDESTRLLDDQADSSSSTYRPNDKATGFLWGWCTEGTKTYIIILLSTCLIAASNPPFQSALTRLYKDFLCCQQDPSRCHDRQWCEVESGSATERALSTIFQYQSILNALGGAIFVLLWYWVIWPCYQSRSGTQSKFDMKLPLILSQSGVLLLEAVNTAVAYCAQARHIDTTTFKVLVICAPVVSFLIGGGPYMYWAMRENIISVSVGSSSSSPSRAANTTTFHFRQLAFAFLTLCTLATQWLSSELTRDFISQNAKSDTAYLNCLVRGLCIFAVGLSILFFLPEIPRPTTPEPRSPTTQSTTSDPEPTNEAQTSQRSVQRPVCVIPPSISRIYGELCDLPSTIRARPVMTLVILSGIARSPLTSSVSSNFAIRYISRRLSVDTSEAVSWTTCANIAPLIVILCLKGAPAIAALRRTDAPHDSDSNNDTSTISHDGTAANGIVALNPGTAVGSSTPPSSPSTELQEQNPEQQNDETPISFSHIRPALVLLLVGLIGTCMMTITPSLDPARIDVTRFVKSAITLISAGTSYPVFIEPILAGWAAEGNKPGVFAAQQIINGVFTSIGALLLNLGFQKEAGGGRTDGNWQIGWTYVGILLVCVAAAGFLIGAVCLSRNR